MRSLLPSFQVLCEACLLYTSGIAIYRDPATNAEWKEELTIYGSMPVSNITLHDGSAVMYLSLIHI